MDNGEVTALAAGAATITATITVEGVDYSDTCEVSVEAASLNISPFFSEALDSPYWEQCFYTHTNRQKYITKDGESYLVKDGCVGLVYNPDGTSGNLYMDARPKAMPELEDGATYTLLLEHFTIGDPGDLKTQIMPNERNQLRGDSTLTYSSWDGEFYIPFVAHNTGSETCLCTIQVSGTPVDKYYPNPSAGIRLSLYKGEYSGPYVPPN